MALKGRCVGLGRGYAWAIIVNDEIKDDRTSRLSPREKNTLGFLIDLEDRGSEWPDRRRIINSVGVTSSVGGSLLASLEEKGYVDVHLNLNKSNRQYSITPTGRACYFEAGS